jgi:hypothetical protein
VIVLAVAYGAGFRIGPELTLNRVGYVSITGLPKGANVYTDSFLQGTTSKAGTMNFELIPGTHAIIVGTPADYPWSTTLVVASGKKETISPILVATNFSGTPLTGADKTAALAAIASTTLPTEANPLVISGACASVYVANNQLIEDPATSTPSCTPPPYLCVGGSCASTIIYAPLAPISSILPFPGRSDAIVILLDHNIYALALDPTSPQFFAPIGHGHDPADGLYEGSIVVSDGGDVSKIAF